MNVRELAEILRQELGPEQAARAIRCLMAQAAGECVYIPRRPGPPEILPTDTPRRVAERYGVSRSTAHAWLASFRAQRSNRPTFP